MIQCDGELEETRPCNTDKCPGKVLYIALRMLFTFRVFELFRDLLNPQLIILEIDDFGVRHLALVQSEFIKLITGRDFLLETHFRVLLTYSFDNKL